MNKTLIISKKECAELLTYEKCIPAMKESLLALSQKTVKVLQRQMIVHENENKLALMPASDFAKGITGAKVIIFPGPKTRITRTQQGIVPLFDIETGRLLAITDAEVMTSVRTASTTAAATDVLARPDAKVLTIMGAGKQGKAHALAISKVRNLEKIYVWSYKETSINSTVEFLSEKLPGVEVIPCPDAKTAVENADIVCTTTSASRDTAILHGEWLKDGVHVNAVGACAPFLFECDVPTLKACRIFTDWTEAAARDSGDLAIPLAAGKITMDDIVGEVGQVMSGEIQGRTSPADKTFFETVGISVQDLLSANIVYHAAQEQNMGVYVEI